jgi:pimeloyl-ACP methyl ester carboxylesterase
LSLEATLGDLKAVVAEVAGGASLEELVRRRAAAPPIAAPAVVLTAMKGRPEQYRQPVLDVQEGLVAVMSRAVHEVLWDSGHYIHVERPQRVVSAINEVMTLALSDRS